MNHNLDRLLNLCLEIEGLIALANRREDNTPAQVLELLREKTANLSQGVNELSAETLSVAADNEDADMIAQAATYEEQGDACIDCAAPVVEPMVLPEPKADVEEPVVSAVVDEPAVADSMCDSEMPRIADRPAEFSINDKFRFRRELFGNSDIELNEALNVINAMSSVSEIEDYFYNDLCWDPENDDVKDFIRIVSARFDNRN